MGTQREEATQARRVAEDLSDTDAFTPDVEGDAEVETDEQAPQRRTQAEYFPI